MFGSIKRIFAPPVFPGDEEKTRTAFMLNSILLLSFVFGIFPSSLMPGDPAFRRFSSAAGHLLLLIVAKALMHGGWVRAACLLTLACLSVGLTQQNLTAGGIRAPGFANHAIIVLTAGMTLGSRAAVVFGCIAISTGIGLVLLENAGLLPVPVVVNSANRYLTVYSWTFAMAASILWIALRCLHQALDRARGELTERKQIEGALRESEERFRSTFEQAAVGIAHVSPDGRLIRVNRRFCDFVGYDQDELLFLSFREITHPEDLEVDIESVRRMLDGSLDSYSVEKRYLKKAGSVVWANLTVSLVSRLSGAPEYFINIVEDITERKEAEERILTYQNQLRSMAMQLSMVEDEERRRIAVELHDRIGPNLALANMMLTSLPDHLTPLHVHAVLADACKSLREASLEVKSLIFEISSPELHELGLGAAIEELALHFEAKYGIGVRVTEDELRTELNHEIRTVLYRVVQELMVNVVKHAEASQMEISIRHDNRHVQVDVVDDGVGFDNAGAGRSEGRSRTFGLFSARERIEYLGGCLHVQSKPGRGTRIGISVPLK